MKILSALLSQNQIECIALSLGIITMIIFHWRMKDFLYAFLFSTIAAPAVSFFVLILYSSMFTWYLMGLVFIIPVSAALSAIIGGVFFWFRRHS